MSGNGIYILVFILLLLFIIPAEILVKIMLFGAIFIAIILGFAAYKFNKFFKKFKENQSENNQNSQNDTDQPKSEKSSSIKSLNDDEFDLSKNNVIESDYEEL